MVKDRNVFQRPRPTQPPNYFSFKYLLSQFESNGPNQENATFISS